MAKTFMGVVHLAPLPSSTGFAGSIEDVITAALADARALADGGVDAIMVENFGDAPFHKGTTADPVPPDVPAALAVIARAVREATRLPVGVNCLRNDGVAALGAASIAEATWVRINIFTGAYVTDQGLIDSEAARVIAYRKRLGSSVSILADLFVKHAAPLAEMDLRSAARDLADRSGADGLILTGRRTGEPVDPDFVREVRAAVADFPIWIGSGLCLENAPALWPLVDGAIVGSSLKRDGIRSAVDSAAVLAMRQELDALS